MPAVVGLEGRTLLSGLPPRAALRRPPAAIVGRPLETAAVWDPDSQALKWVPYEPLAASLRDDAAAARPRVVFLGDSITAFWSLAGATPWSDRIARFRPANLGIAGDDALGLLWRIEQGALDPRPGVAVIQVGINDLRSNQVEAPEVADRIRASVAAVRERSPGTQVLVLGLTPTGDAATNAAVDDVNDRLASTARARGYTFLNIGARLARPDGSARPGMLSDTVHLSPAAYARIAPVLSLSLRRLLNDAATIARAAAAASA